MSLLSWPALGSLAAGVGSAYLLWRLYPVRDRPGARWFLLAVAVQTVMCTAYAAALSVSGSPGLRWLLEVVTVSTLFWLGVPFLGFALAYTGRREALGSWWFKLLLAAEVATALVLVTNPYHHLFWSEFQLQTVFGATGAVYDFGPWAFVAAAINTVTVGAGTGLLFETVLSYGPLYRREAFAVGASTIPPAVGVLIWLLKISPEPALNLTPILFLPHVALDAYAFVGNDMFEFYPATRRAAEQSATDALGAPVVILDDRGRVVDANDAASGFFEQREGARTRSLSDVLGTGIDLDGGTQRLSLARDGVTKEFQVTPARLDDTGGGHVGYTVVFQDVTDEVRREQRLSVLNRVLRHNLRNSLTVATGYVGASADRTDDAEIESMLADARAALDGLVATGEKARHVEEVIERASVDPEPVDVGALVEESATPLRADFPAATLTVEGAGTVVTIRPLLAAVIENLVENACEHGGSEPAVTVTVTDDDGRLAGDGQNDDEHGGGVTVAISDAGPGIPDHELATLSAGEETDLQHGSGLGLWVVRWGVELLGADLTFESDEAGTTATVWIPDRED